MPAFIKRILRSSQLKNEINLLFTSVFALSSLYILFVAIFDRPFFDPMKKHANATLYTPSTSNSSHAQTFSNSTQLSSRTSPSAVDDVDHLIISFFSIFFLWICALCAGHLLHYVDLPPLFGMLLVGIVFANVPFLRSAILIRPSWDQILRKTAFVLILVRCAVGLNPKALRESLIFCSALGIFSTIFEILAIVFVSHFLFNVSLATSILFGFVLASTSPAVTVPTMIHFQQNQLGTQKGIPTMVLASASIDNIFSISGFTVAYAVVSAPSDQIISTSIWVCVQLFLAILIGCITGALLICLPSPHSPSVHFSRSLLICSISMALYFGTKAANIEISGPIAVIIACFVAAVRWKADNAQETKVEAEVLRLIWNLLLLPLLFVLIGLLFDISIFTFSMLFHALITILIGVSVRFTVVFLITLPNKQLNWPEKLFFSTVFLPKATVQAALAPVLFQFASSSADSLSQSSAQFVLQSCILSILLTAPSGQLIIQLLGNKMLSPNNAQKVAEMDKKCSVKNDEEKENCEMERREREDRDNGNV